MSVEQKRRNAVYKIRSFYEEHRRIPRTKEAVELLAGQYGSRTSVIEVVNVFKGELAEQEKKQATAFKIPSDLTKALMTFVDTAKQEAVELASRQLERERLSNEDMQIEVNSTFAEIESLKERVVALEDEHTAITTELNSAKEALNSAKKLSEQQIKSLSDEVSSQREVIKEAAQKEIELRAHIKSYELEAQRNREQLEQWKLDNKQLNEDKSTLLAQVAVLNSKLDENSK